MHVIEYSPCDKQCHRYDVIRRIRLFCPMKSYCRMTEMFNYEYYFTLLFVQYINVPYNCNKSDFIEYCKTVLSV